MHNEFESGSCMGLSDADNTEKPDSHLRFLKKDGLKESEL